MVKSSIAKPSKSLQAAVLANTNRNITLDNPERLAALCFAVTQPALPPLTIQPGLDDCIFPDQASWLPMPGKGPSLYHLSERHPVVSTRLPNNCHELPLSIEYCKLAPSFLPSVSQNTLNFK